MITNYKNTYGNRLPILITLLIILNGCQTFGGLGGVGSGIVVAGTATGAAAQKTRPELSYLIEKDVSFSAGLGHYFHRSGILKEAGKMGPTLSFDMDFLSKSYLIRGLRHGLHIFWSFDHFWKTDNGVLEQEYWNKNFTNYMGGAGWDIQYSPWNSLRFDYNIGVAINFLEIDTFGPTNNHYKDSTISLTHKISGEYNIASKDEVINNDGNYDRLWVGASIFAYWTPDPLGKFLNDQKYKDSTPENSWAWLIHLKWDYH